MNNELKNLVAQENSNALEAAKNKFLRFDLLAPLMKEWTPLDSQRQEQLLDRRRILPFSSSHKQKAG